MDIDLRRLGMGAQLQIALALVGRGAERRDNHGTVSYTHLRAHET